MIEKCCGTCHWMLPLPRPLWNEEENYCTDYGVSLGMTKLVIVEDTDGTNCPCYQPRETPNPAACGGGE